MTALALKPFQLCCFAVVCAAAVAGAWADERIKLPAPSWASIAADNSQAPSLESVVDELNDRVTAVEKENRRLRSVVHGGWQHWTSEILQNDDDEYEMEFQGRIHVDVWSYPDSSPGVSAFESGNSMISPQDRLELRRARFAAEGELPYDTLYKLDFEFSEASQPQFRDLYVGWDNIPFFGRLLYGNQKRPYGLDHLNSSNFNVFMERPFIVQAFNRNNRRFGVMAYGVSEDESWNWRYGVVNLREVQSDGLYTSDHWQLEGVGRLAHTIVNYCEESNYMHVAVAPSYAVPDGDPGLGRAKNEAHFQTEPEARTERQWLNTGIIRGANKYSVLGLESVINLGRCQLVGEYMNLWLDRDPAFGDDVHFHGGYLYLSYFLTDHYQPWNRKLGIIDRVAPLTPGDTCAWEGCGAWQIAVRWSFADLSDRGVQGGVGESIAFGLNWYWTPRSRLQLNCAYGDITEHFPIDGQTFGSYVTLGTRVQVDF